MNYQELLKKAEEHVKIFYADHVNNAFLYHNLEHAKEMAANAGMIASHDMQDERMKCLVMIAALFHDAGFLVQRQNFEEKSVELATGFLQNMHADENDIAEVRKCIMATAALNNPESIAEKIICDAATFYFGTKDFKERNKLLRRETEMLSGKNINGREWRAAMINLLEKHIYHTDYCNSLPQDVKASNLADLKYRQNKKLMKNVPQHSDEHLLNDKEINAKTKRQQPEKSVDTMFRIAAANNVRISSMADNKAHIMITVNSIIISLVLGFIVRNMQDAPHYIIPAATLLSMSVATVIFAVLATRPRVSTGTFTQKQVEDKSVNLMYFGSYHQMNFNEYKHGMQHMMYDPDFLYNSLTKDLFWQGKVLGRKYRLLHISYGIFMYGLIVSVVAFICVYMFY